MPSSAPSASAPSAARTHLHFRPLPVLLVFVGGGAGTFARYAVELMGTPWALPLPTLAVNLVGAFLLGLLLEALLRRGPDAGWRQHARLLLGPGFMGGFTTYSTFAVETVLLTQHGHYVIGFGYAIVSLILGVAAAAAGVWLAANVVRVPPVLTPGHSVLDSTQTLHLAQRDARAGQNRPGDAALGAPHPGDGIAGVDPARRGPAALSADADPDVDAEPALPEADEADT